MTSDESEAACVQTCIYKNGAWWKYHVYVEESVGIQVRYVQPQKTKVIVSSLVTNDVCVLRFNAQVLEQKNPTKSEAVN